MKPTPVYDFHTPLTEICSREDYLYKQSLRKSLCPTFVPDTTRYAVHASARTVKKTGRPVIQVSELEQEIKRIKQDSRMRERLQRQQRLIENQDKFAKVRAKESEESLAGLAQKKLLHAGDERNKLAELNYLLHRKKAPAHSQHAFQEEDCASPERPRIKSAEKYQGSASGDRTYDTTHTSPGRRRAEHTIPFAIGDSMAADDIILEAEDEQPDRDVERIEYRREQRAEEPGLKGQTRAELLALIGEMEEEINCLTKDLEEARAAEERAPGSTPRAFREKLRAFLIRNNWHLNEVRAAAAEKDKRAQQLLDLLKKHDQAQARNLAKSEPDLGFKLAEPLAENELLLAELLAADPDNPAEAPAGLQTPAQEPSGPADLQDQLEACKHKLALYEDYFKRLHKFDKSLVKLTSEQLLTRGSEYSAELLLRALEQQADKLAQAEEKNRQVTGELVRLKQGVADIEGLVEGEKKALVKELDDLRIICNPAVVRIESMADPKSMSPLELARLVRERVTRMKIENDDFLARLSLMEQRADLRDVEVRSLKDRLNEAVREGERNLQEKHLLEDKLGYAEIQLQARKELPAAQEEEIKKRLREEHRREVKALTDRLAQAEQAYGELAAQAEQQHRDSKQAQTQTPAPAPQLGEEDPLTWVMRQLSAVLLRASDDSALDPAVRRQVLEVFGAEKGQQILNYEKVVSMFKLKCKLIEEIYRDRLANSQASLRKASSQLLHLLDFARACEQFDPRQPKTFPAVQSLAELKVKSAYLGQLLEELRVQMTANQRVFLAGESLDLLKREAGALGDAQFPDREADCSRDGLRQFDNSRLEELLRDRETDPSELLGLVRPVYTGLAGGALRNLAQRAQQKTLPGRAPARDPRPAPQPDLRPARRHAVVRHTAQPEQSLRRRHAARPASDTGPESEPESEPRSGPAGHEESGGPAGHVAGVRGAARPPQADSAGAGAAGSGGPRATSRAFREGDRVRGGGRTAASRRAQVRDFCAAERLAKHNGRRGHVREDQGLAQRDAGHPEGVQRFPAARKHPARGRERRQQTVAQTGPGRRAGAQRRPVRRIPGEPGRDHVQPPLPASQSAGVQTRPQELLRYLINSLTRLARLERRSRFGRN